MICPAAGCSDTPRGTHQGLGFSQPNCTIPSAAAAEGSSPRDHQFGQLQKTSPPFGRGNTTNSFLSHPCAHPPGELCTSPRGETIVLGHRALPWPDIKAQCPTQEHPKGLSCSMGTGLLRSRLGAGVRCLHYLQNPTLLFITPKQNLSQEQRSLHLHMSSPRFFVWVFWEVSCSFQKDD